MKEELSRLYRDVLEAIAGADVPPELREVAFVKGLEISLGPAGVPTLAPAPASSIGSVTLGGPTGEPVDRIARQLKIDVDVIHEVFHDDEGKLGIGLASSRLAKGQAAGTKQLALLVAAGRQAGGYDEGYTRVADIREICRDFGRLDSSNFSATIQEMAEEFTFKGKGQDRQVHVTKPGWDKTRELVLRLTTGAS